MTMLEQFIIESELYQSIQDIETTKIISELESCVSIMECLEKEQRIIESSVDIDSDSMVFYFETLTMDPTVDIQKIPGAGNFSRAARGYLTSMSETIYGMFNFITGIGDKITSLFKALFAKSSPEHFAREIKKYVNNDLGKDVKDKKISEVFSDADINKMRELGSKMNAVSGVLCEIASNIYDIRSNDEVISDRVKDMTKEVENIRKRLMDEKLSDEESSKLRVEMYAKVEKLGKMITRDRRNSSINPYNETYLSAVNMSIDFYQIMYAKNNVPDISSDRQKALEAYEQNLKKLYDKEIEKQKNPKNDNEPRLKDLTVGKYVDDLIKVTDNFNNCKTQIARLRRHMNFKPLTDLSVYFGTTAIIRDTESYSNTEYNGHVVTNGNPNNVYSNGVVAGDDGEKKLYRNKEQVVHDEAIKHAYLEKSSEEDVERNKKNTLTANDSNHDEWDESVFKRSDLDIGDMPVIKLKESEMNKKLRAFLKDAKALIKKTYKISMNYYKEYYKYANELLELVKKADVSRAEKPVKEYAEDDIFAPVQESEFHYMNRIIEGGYCELFVEAPNPEADTDGIAQKIASAFEKVKGFFRSIFVHSSPEYLAKVINKMDDASFTRFISDHSNLQRFMVLGSISAINATIIEAIDNGEASQSIEFLKFSDYVVQLLIGVMKSWSNPIPDKNRVAIFDSTKQALLKVQEYETNDRPTKMFKDKILRTVQEEFNNPNTLNPESKEAFIKSVSNLVARHKKYSKHAYNKQAMNGMSKVDKDSWAYIKKLIIHTNQLSKYSGNVINAMLKGNAPSESSSTVGQRQDTANNITNNQLGNNNNNQNQNQSANQTQDAASQIGGDAANAYNGILEIGNKYAGKLGIRSLSVQEASNAASKILQMVNPDNNQNQSLLKELYADSEKLFNRKTGLAVIFKNAYKSSRKNSNNKNENQAVWEPYIKNGNSVLNGFNYVYELIQNKVNGKSKAVNKLIINPEVDQNDSANQATAKNLNKNFNKNFLEFAEEIPDINDYSKFDVYLIGEYGASRLIAENATIESIERITTLTDLTIGANTTEDGRVYAIVPNKKSAIISVCESFGFSDDDDDIDDSSASFNVIQISEFGSRTNIATVDTYAEAVDILESYANDTFDDIEYGKIVSSSTSRFIIE